MSASDLAEEDARPCEGGGDELCDLMCSKCDTGGTFSSIISLWQLTCLDPPES